MRWSRPVYGSYFMHSETEARQGWDICLKKHYSVVCFFVFRDGLSLATQAGLKL